MPVLHAGWYRSQLFLWAAAQCSPDHFQAASPWELKAILGQILPQCADDWESPRSLKIYVPQNHALVARAVHGIALRPALFAQLRSWLDAVSARQSAVVVGEELRVLKEAFVFAHRVVASGTYIPGLADRLGYCRPIWKPWWSEDQLSYVKRLGAILPDVARALGHPPMEASSLIRQWIEDLVDNLIRQADLTPPQDVVGPYGQWLKGLYGGERSTIEPRPTAELLVRALAKWEHDARERAHIPYRLCFRIEEQPLDSRSSGLWHVRLLLESLESKGIPLERSASDIDEEDWARLLHWAAPYSTALAQALKGRTVEGFYLNTERLLSFIEDDAAQLKRAGATILLPAWWKGRKRRLNLTAQVHRTHESAIRIGDVHQVDWRLALGQDPLSLEELKQLAVHQQRLVQFRGQWIELADDVIRWTHRLQSLPTEVDTGTAIRWGIEGQISTASSQEDDALPATVKAEGWMAEVIARLLQHETMEPVSPSPAFHGTLRPYQLRGLAWLDFLHRFGLGACLADDMGLGKTVQALALVDRDYQQGIRRPVLLVCPTSVVANWQREAERFTPELPITVHQGPERLRATRLRDAASRAGLLVTSYPILRADAEDLLQIDWHGVIFDEAQNIKNAATRQSQIACQLRSEYRVALTGTPLENRLEELWSLMRFLNPGLLGSQDAFRRRYANLNQTDASDLKLNPLHRQIEPFLLRRVKTDPAIIDDLPDKIEIKEYCHLTREQASLYQAVLDRLATKVQDLDAISRRGLILATLTHLKQILNHPAHFLGDHSSLGGRSGKLTRLDELLEEILAENHRALIFTQFARMGMLLEQYLWEHWGERALFLHGAMKPKERELMVRRFQEEDHGPRLFLLSLRAGGTGLNLTRASHVIHYDRWWNPAVENQATDRAFRIGQHQNVTVHKFVSMGTVEDRIDRMIEEKTLLAERIVGRGESWITELSTADLQQLLALHTPGEDEND